ncbi:unnamed protein product [Phytomonas sp. EM1]|nr:unnamed protein product [Phytomonas sp. EM1]|eukprot:CCW63215.1 unnamed protein product [Phytomonas sp. isolate EM1]
MTTTFTAEQLAHFVGHDGSPIYISVKGNVYDCTTGSNFYGQDGPYKCFAGKEVSRGLAKMILTGEEDNSGWDNLSEQHMSTLNGWVEKFNSKYPVVGTFQPDPEFKSRGEKFDP